MRGVRRADETCINLGSQSRQDLSILTSTGVGWSKGVGDVGRSVLRERRVLSEEGLVAVTMAFDEETGIIIYGPERAR